jgi:hypothetical protein
MHARDRRDDRQTETVVRLAMFASRIHTVKAVE